MKVYCAVVGLHRQAGRHPLAVAVCPVLDTTGRPSTNDPLQPTRCIRMQGGELAGTWPGALRPRVCKVLDCTTYRALWW